MGSRWPRALAALLALLIVGSACGIFNGTTTTTAPSITATSPTPTEPSVTTTTTEPTAIPCVAPDVVLQIGDVTSLISNRLIGEYQTVRHDDLFVTENCWYDWTTDDCSVPVGGTTQIAVDFEHPCHRHDFGYRNYKRIETDHGQDVWNEVQKLVVDDQFLEDTRSVCAPRSLVARPVCLAWSQIFYWAVRLFGGFDDALLN